MLINTLDMLQEGRSGRSVQRCRPSNGARRPVGGHRRLLIWSHEAHNAQETCSADLWL